MSTSACKPCSINRFFAGLARILCRRKFTFAKRFSAAATKLGWTNCHSTKDSFLADSEDRVKSVIIALGQFSKEIPGFDGLTLLVRAVRHLADGKERIEFLLFRDKNPVQPDQITTQADAAVQAAMSEFITAFQALT